MEKELAKAAEFEKIFEDKHLTLNSLGFDPTSGEVKLIIEEHEDNVGFYYVTVAFGSGDQTRVDYDGGNPRRDRYPVVRSSHLKDSLVDIKVIRVRD